MNFSSVVELLQRRALDAPRGQALVFLDDDGSESSRTYAQLDERARTLARALLAQAQPGERALLLFPPGLEYIEALLGCLYAQLLAVPVYPPDLMRAGRTLPRLEAIAKDASASLILTTTGIAELAGDTVAELSPALAGLRWMTTDDVLTPPAGEAWQPRGLAPTDIAFLQYTSGSTGTPKGVMLTHRNLLHNSELIHRTFGSSAQSKAVIWLPPYHDMGLIGGILQPLYGGFPGVLMSPLGFLSAPSRWLQAISTHRATVSGGPNFAFELCVRKTSAEQRAALDLSSWKVAFTGAEPIRPDTLDRFEQAFGPCGFRREAFLPCYGLAEGTLLVSGEAISRAPVVSSFDKEGYDHHQVREVPGDAAGALTVVGCGPPVEDGQLLIVEPESRRPIAVGGGVGEIWVRGESVAAGYWQNPQLTEETFHAVPSEGPAHRYLRTGDLGFLHQGELFVTGRRKDLIIVRGRNHYPQDLERDAELSHPALRPGCSVAFGVDAEGEERVVLVLELDARRPAPPEEVVGAVLDSLSGAHGLDVFDVVLIKPGTLPKTSSGKVQRRATRAAYLEGTLERLGSKRGTDTAPAEASSGRVGMLRKVLSARLGVANEKLGEQPITALGLDSLKAVELRADLESAFGVSLPLSVLLQGPTVAELGARLTDAAATAPQATATSAASDAEATPRPLTAGEQGLWLWERLHPGRPLYTLARAARSEGLLDATDLRRALELCMLRHPALRSAVETREGKPWLAPREAGALRAPLEVEDARGLSAEALQARLDTAAERPFQLSAAPLFRVLLLQGNDTSHLLFAVHHLVADFWSLAILVQELGEIYRALRAGEAPRLPAPAPWRAAPEKHDESEERFWRERLAHGTAGLSLPVDSPRPREPSCAAHVIALDELAPLTAALRTLATERATTPYTVLLAAYQAFLARVGGTESVRVGSPTTGRGRSGVERAVGYHVNMVVLGAQVEVAETFAAFVQRTRGTVLEALAHADYPLARLVQSVGSTEPLFQAAFAYQDAPGKSGRELVPFALQKPGSVLPWPGTPLRGVALSRRFLEPELLLELGETEDGLWGTLQASEDRFELGTARALAEAFQSFLAALLQHPQAPMVEAPLASAPQREAALVHSRAPTTPASADTLHELFLRQAARAPDAIAVQGEARRLTYAELAQQSASLAAELIRLGVRPGAPVGIFLERSPEALVALLGVLRAGAFYIPLDPGYPAARLEEMLGDAAPAVVLTTRGLEAQLSRSNAQRCYVDAPRAVFSGSLPSVSAETAAYALFTSGSTGRPKAAQIPHAAVVNLLAEVAARAPLSSGGRGTLWTSLSFDVSGYEIFSALREGATVELAPDAVRVDPARFTAFLRARRITSAYVPGFMLPALLAEARAHPERLPLQRLLVGVEAIPESLLLEIAAQIPGLVLLNGYGPTETAIVATLYRVGAGAAYGSAPIGRPVHNTQAYLLDERRQLVADGVPGELFLGGRGVGLGYWQRPELTAERFLADPFSHAAHARMYRSGDRVRRRASGELEFLGRVDGQLKLRGLRFEPGDVEAALRRHPSVEAAAVAVRVDGRGQPQLLAWVVPAKTKALEATELRAHLRSLLPSGLVPTGFVSLDTLPLTPSGKLDRAALRTQAAPEDATSRELVAPRDEREAELARCFAEVLGVAAVSVEDDFFHLGGHSLLAVDLLARVRARFGVELPLRAIFDAPTVASLAALLQQTKKAEQAPWPIPRRPAGDDVPLSYAQESLWFRERLEPGTGAYHLAGAVRLAGTLDVAALRDSLSAVLARHQALRATFGALHGRPVQRIGPVVPAVLAEVDLSALATEARRAEAQRLALEDAQHPFDLEHGPLLRARLLRLAPREHELVIVVHHLVSDGLGLGVLCEELGAFYRERTQGAPSNLPPLGIQYPDFAAWERAELSGERLQAHAAFWKAQLGTTPPVLELPTDRRRPAAQTFRGGHVRFTLPASLHQELLLLARTEGSTLFMALLAGYQALLARYAHQEDFVVGAVSARRGRAETAPLIGMFADTLPMRADLSEAPSFRELLRRVRARSLDALAHEDLPFHKVVEAVQPPRAPSHSPIFQVAFGMQPPLRALALGDLKLTLVPLETGSAKWDLTLMVDDERGELPATLEYRADLFDAATVERMAEHLRTLLEAAVREPDRPTETLPLTTPAERAQVVETWGHTSSPFDSTRCPHQLVEAHARARPGSLAVQAPQGSLTYAELEARANQLAHHLRTLGVGRESRVALLLERNPDFVVAMVAVLKAGGVFVSLDATHPVERLLTMLADCQPTVLLTTASLQARATGFSGTRLLLDAEASRSEWTKHPPTPLGGVTVDADQLAYIVYTSGSTGQPKGVCVSHRNLAHLIHWYGNFYQVTPADRVCAVSGLGFDGIILDCWPALGAGASLALPPEDARLEPRRLQAWLADAGVTLGLLPTGLAELLFELPWDRPTSLRTLLVGGDRLRQGPPDALPFEVVNNYGPTEGTVVATAGRTPKRSESARVPSIGKPVSNGRLYILDRHQQPAPVGVPGELYLGGANVARGYTQPTLTEERFLADPFQPGQRMYRTGDLARWLPNGEVDFLGRVDSQVKVRGFRVELGEVEAALLRNPDVAEAVVVAQPDARGTQRLIAYVVARRADATRAQLEAAARESLPDFMVPSAWMLLPQLPQTPSGKVDRRALPAPQLQDQLDHVQVPPRTPLERELCTLWEELLAVPTVGVTDNFFTLGGHSLLATQLLSRVRERFGVEVPLRELFARPTVEQLAQEVQQASHRPSTPRLASAEPSAEKVDAMSAEELDALIAQLEKEGTES